MSKLKAGLGILVVAGAALMIFLQYQTQQQLRHDNESLQQEIAQVKAGSPDAPTEAPAANGDERNELLRLRGEVGALRSQTNQIAKLQQQNQQLQDSLVAAVQARQKSVAQAEDEHTYTIHQVSVAKQAALGMIMYATDNQDQFPTNFNQAAPYYGNPNSDTATNLVHFEIVYQGPMANIANPSSAVIVRSSQPWMVNGKWTRVYAFADGHVESHSDPNGNFDDWEKQHAPILKGQ